MEGYAAGKSCSVNCCFEVLQFTYEQNVSLSFKFGLAVLAASVAALVLGCFAVAGYIILGSACFYGLAIFGLSIYNGCTKSLDSMRVSLGMIDSVKLSQIIKQKS